MFVCVIERTSESTESTVADAIVIVERSAHEHPRNIRTTRVFARLARVARTIRYDLYEIQLVAAVVLCNLGNSY